MAAAICKCPIFKGNMSVSINSKQTSQRPGMLRSIIIAAVAAFALGALSAFVSKVAWSNPNAPVATSGSAPMSM